MTGTRTAEVLSGIGVGRGVVVARVAVVSPAPELPVDEAAPSDPEEAAEVVRRALDDVATAMARRATGAATASLRGMLEAAAAMAADPALTAEATRLVRSGAGPATAVHRAVEGFAEAFTAAGGPLAERVTDLWSVRHRAVARILGLPEPGLDLREPSVVVAEDLSPADTAALDLDLVLGIVTELGGPTGHTAIIAGQLGLPCLVQVPGASSIPQGTTVVVDAGAGTLHLDPSEDLVAAVGRRREADRALAVDRAPGATADGHRLALLANVGTPDDAVRAAGSGAEGVGLFRTEVLFLDRMTPPSFDEQRTAYRAVLDALPGRKVVVRTLDAGADKPLGFAQQAFEENPALGVRGYRLNRTMPELLATQLAALAAAADEADAEVGVMAPMVATVTEARRFVEEARAAGLGTVGVMVEVPAAALAADLILGIVDFVSLGTNDLAQYTMAADRLRGELADLLDIWQPAVLGLVATTASAGRATGKPVGVCGESASDPVMALVLAGLGVTSLSMSPAALPAVRYALRQHTLAQCRAIAAAATSAADAASARAAALAEVAAEVRAVLGL